MATKKKSLPKKLVKNKISRSVFQYSLKDKKEARDIAITELTNLLVKAEDGETIRFGELGTFTKTKQKIKIKSNLLKKATNKTYLYYRIGFRASRILKRELDK